tara:strand:- start:387 stop:602 length:216 start_codon:yes stop_codon:yes gene_type:complete
MPLDDMKIHDVVDIFERVWAHDDTMGEKDFFEFMKRANRDLTRHQRHVIVTITINAIRGGLIDVKKNNSER